MNADTLCRIGLLAVLLASSGCRALGAESGWRAAPGATADHAAVATPHGLTASIVRVRVQVCQNGQCVIDWGSGILAEAYDDGTGLVATCSHIVRDNREGTVHFAGGAGSTFRAVHYNPRDEVALLLVNVPPGIEPPEIADAPPPVGEELYFAGYGQDGRLAWQKGHVTKYIGEQSTMPELRPGLARQGDSGGPIINRSGCLVAVLWGSYPRSSEGPYTVGCGAGPLRRLLAGVRGRLGKRLRAPPRAMIQQPMQPPRLPPGGNIPRLPVNNPAEPVNNTSPTVENPGHFGPALQPRTYGDEGTPNREPERPAALPPPARDSPVVRPDPEPARDDGPSRIDSESTAAGGRSKEPVAPQAPHSPAPVTDADELDSHDHTSPGSEPATTRGPLPGRRDAPRRHGDTEEDRISPRLRDSVVNWTLVTVFGLSPATAAIAWAGLSMLRKWRRSKRSGAKRSPASEPTASPVPSVGCRWQPGASTSSEASAASHASASSPAAATAVPTPREQLVRVQLEQDQIERLRTQYVTEKDLTEANAWARAAKIVAEKFPGTAQYMKVLERVKDLVLSGNPNPEP